MRQPPSIDAYGGGGFRVAGRRHEGSLLILDDQPRPWAATSADALTADDLQSVIDQGRAVEFVLLGTGKTQTLPPRALRDALRDAGIGLEFMDTATAAREYNLLASDGRRIAAALIAI